MDENGIRFLRLKRFWNLKTPEEEKTVLRQVLPVSLF